MQVRLLAGALLVVIAGALTTGAVAGDVHATIGTNAVPMPEASTTYRLGLDGTATRVATAPAASAGTTSPNRHYRVELGNPGTVLIDVRSGARRRLAPWSPAAAAYWSSTSVLAYTVHVSRIERLVVFDPGTGRQRRLASRICDTAMDPWSPDGTRLALAVSLPHAACRGTADAPIVVGVTATWGTPLRRIRGGPGLTRSEPLAWTRDGTGLVVAARSGLAAPLSAVIDLHTGVRRALFPAYGLGGGGAWSSGHRFFALSAIDRASHASLLIANGAFHSLVGAFTFGQQAYAWAPRRPLLALASGSSIRVFDAAARRVVATIPVRAPYGISVDSLAWAPDGRSLTLVVAPGLGHD